MVSPLKFVATLKLWPDWDAFSGDFPGDWTATFEFDFDKSEPWICTSLAVLPPTGATMGKMLYSRLESYCSRRIFGEGSC